MQEHSDIKIETVDYATRRHQRALERAARRRWHRSLPAVGAAVVAVIMLLVAFEMIVSVGKVHPGVSVSGVQVGGMLPERAALELSSELPRRFAKPVIVVHGDREWTFSPADVGLTFDAQALADDAMAVGRSGGVFAALGSRVRAWFGGVELDASRATSATAMADVVSTVAEGTNVAPVDATVEIEDVEPQVVPARNGVALDQDGFARKLVAAFVSARRTVTAPVVVAPVSIDDDDANAAAAVARAMLSAPAKVTYDERTWVFQPEQLAEWISFEPSSFLTTETVSSTASATLVAAISPELAEKPVVKALGTKVGRKAVDARFKTSSGSVAIVPSKTGIGPDLDVLTRELTRELSDPSSQRTVELRTTTTEPKLTTAEARKMGIKRRISVFTTTYSSSNRPRVNNIHTLGDALDGTLVAPGKTFSFNKTIGQRTAAKGYQEANAIVNGKLVPQLGGGICQVGSTIFNTVFDSGLPVLERKNHSFYISHYPKGRDATVSWGGPDFKFKNDTDHWVLIAVSYTNTSITIALYGTDPGYDVEADVSEWRNVKDFSVEKIKDNTIAKGSKVVEDPGVKGRSITVKRTVTKDGKVIRTDTFVSVYKPKTEVVRIGTKPVPPAEPVEDTPED